MWTVACSCGLFSCVHSLIVAYAPNVVGAGRGSMFVYADGGCDVGGDIGVFGYMEVAETSR